MESSPRDDYRALIAVPGSEEFRRIKSLITLHERRCQRMYLDRPKPEGRWTVGIGRNIEDNGLREDEIDLLYFNDYTQAVRELQMAFPWFRHLSVVHRAVLTDMCFNLGITRLKRFQRMLAAWEEGNHLLVIQEMIDSAWYDQVGMRSKRLVAMVRTDNWVH